MTDKVGGKNINVKLVGADVGIFCRHCMKALIPKRHGMNDAVGLGCGSEMAVSLACQFKCETQNAIHASTREYGLLHSHFIFSAFIEAPTNVRVFAFIVLAND